MKASEGRKHYLGSQDGQKDTDRMPFKQGGQCGQSQVERKLASVYFGFGDLQVL